MSIILVVTDSGGKNLVFVTDTLKPLSIDNAAQFISQGKLTGIGVVHSKSRQYLRSFPNVNTKDNLDSLAITSYQLFSISSNPNLAPKLPGFKPYWRLYQNDLENLRKMGERIISIDGQPQTSVKHVIEKLSPYKEIVYSAAKHFSIDPYLLGAIIIDEISRASIIEEITDVLLVYFIGWNSSVGIAQIKIETARGLIRLKYYNPNPDDERLSPENIGRVSRNYLYTYVVKPKHNIFFAAARMKEVVDLWAPFADISNRPEIIASAYSKSNNPDSTPEPNERGLQIVQEFYPLARKILEL